MDVLGTTENPVELPAGSVVVDDTCPQCGSSRTTLVWGGWTTRITRCRACQHEWIAHRNEFASGNGSMIS